MAALFLTAGRKARTTSAHDTAVRFFQSGKALLGEQNWQTDYDLMMGIIGDEKRMDTGIISDTVNTASRLEGLTKYFNAKIIISEASFAFLSEPPGMETRFLGKVAVKGKQEVLPVYEVFNPDTDETDWKKAAYKAGFEAGLARYFEKDFVNVTLQLKEVADQFPEDIVTQQYLRRAASYLVEGVPEEWTGVVTMEGR